MELTAPEWRIRTSKVIPGNL